MNYYATIMQLLTIIFHVVLCNIFDHVQKRQSERLFVEDSTSLNLDEENQLGFAMLIYFG